MIEMCLEFLSRGARSSEKRGMLLLLFSIRVCEGRCCLNDVAVPICRACSHGIGGLVSPSSPWIPDVTDNAVFVYHEIVFVACGGDTCMLHVDEDFLP